MVHMTRNPTPKEYDTGYYMKSWLLEGADLLKTVTSKNVGK